MYYNLKEPTEIYYKGCISSNEQGSQKLSLGYSYLNNIPYYICDTDYCNVDIATVLEESRNGSRSVRDNKTNERRSFMISSMLIVLFYFKFNE
uniref:UPAR/Ly6 domain-containing protein n=1 Tax=Caenorhabditis tropicalis TaxID=1561998 RepID=A0A1I7T1E2_9PELO